MPEMDGFAVVNGIRDGNSLFIFVTDGRGAGFGAAWTPSTTCLGRLNRRVCATRCAGTR